MLRNKLKKAIFPDRFLFRLTLINIVVIIAFVTFSGWAIYNTACLLTDELLLMSAQNQHQFRAMLFQYLWIFSILAVILGGLIHFYLTRKITRPLKELIQFTKKIKQGKYWGPIHRSTDGEIGELIDHFNDLIQQLAINQQDRKKLVSDLSHEFRTPLTNLNGYLSALQNGIITGDKKLYQSLYAESTKLTQLIEQMEQLKEWEEVGARTFEEKESVEMQKFIEESSSIFHWTLEQNKIALDIDVEREIIVINPISLSQVISNLLDNAIRYYQGTGPIAIKGEKKDNEYRISITGPGRMIPVADKDKIFDRLYRTDPSRSRESGGSGLGLAISKEIIERHHGKIGFQSEGHIHTFWFTLPHN